MATMYTSDDVLLVRRYQAICCANQYMQFVMTKTKYGAGSACLNRDLIVLNQWVDMLLRYENPANADEEALNCLTEAQMDHVIEQISKMTGCKFFGKDTVWTSTSSEATAYLSWEWNNETDIEYNDSDPISLNETE